MQKQLSKGLRTVFWAHVVIGLIFGLAFLLIPTLTLQLYDWPPTEPFFPRLVGAAILGFTASSWLALQANEWMKVRIVVQMEILWTILATLVMIWGMFTEPLPALGWVDVIIMAAFAVSFTYFYMLEERLVTKQLTPAGR